ncbi:glycosyltransferase family 10 domain-containing protein [Prosthecobacter sp.]|uniref:glycosyltransferase family 10 domain-containing protein n=1 Tax=Prosthecobacter sp. TaxID=1965333 RepID=UPI0037830FB9
MHKASLVVSWIGRNELFQADHPRNRDSVFAPWILLRERLLQHGIELNTSDVNQGAPVAFELHLDAQQLTVPGAPAYLMLFETPAICPSNRLDSSMRARYRKIFAWNDALVDGEKVIKYNLPCFQVSVPEVTGFTGRPRLCCLISGNKMSRLTDPGELYSERLRTIRWFEKHAPGDFDLYGTNWDSPPRRRGLLGKLEKNLWRHVLKPLGVKPFPSYRGRLEHKHATLQETRFSICYENMQGLPGYFTEKIFDSFTAGCVPVYWGASNVTESIPAGCFLDRRQFKDTGEVYQRMKTMSEDEFVTCQQNICHFLRGSVAESFGFDAFARKVSDTIIQDLDAAGLRQSR